MGEKEEKLGIIQSKGTKFAQPETTSLQTLSIAFYCKYTSILIYHAKQICRTQFLSDSKLEWTPLAF